MRQKPTIRDIASACGVAPSTVSRVLNNRAGEVGEETRLRILDAMRRMNYRPGQTRQAPADKTYTLGVISGITGATYYHEGYFHSLVDSLLAVISERRQNGLIFAPHIFHAAPQQSIRSYCDGQCDGLLVLAPGMESLLVTSLQERGFPLALLGSSGGIASVAYCDLDNIHAVALAMNEFVGMGHRRIALCQGPEGLEATALRHAGYLQALSTAGIPLDEALVSPMLSDTRTNEDSQSIASWVRWVLRALPAGRRPTAILCFNDTHAGSVLEALAALSLRVPEDVSVIGFDDGGSAHFAPPLTTIGQPYREIALHAVEAVLAQIAGNEDSVSQRVLLQGNLIRRQSVAPPSAAD
ncbi:LacI family transcriptional regulator [Capsulimonas corticalis]|uniref:LacI family transcriptional regulator n=1 Tax=Capsulimonas corticalis TaxID=2219043 RepID=A0A402CZ96_9BACT|nr:LacI family DNA-binding transcriptional regulator [Capsulimonas corticalis]BDI29489.1 LacI family transcriptional regulator [Capsulimonas corticalis]